MQPNLIVSFWDMLTVNAGALLYAYQHMTAFRSTLVRFYPNSPEGPHTIDSFILDDLEKFGVFLDILQCPVSRAYLNNAINILSQPFGHIGAAGVELGKIPDVMRIELQSKNIFVLRSGAERYYLAEESLFGPDVAVSFPSASFDIEEAGKCRAVERWTASVLHLMRALDVALFVFQNNLQVDNPKENWQSIIDQINAKIKILGSGPIDPRGMI